MALSPSKPSDRSAGRPWRRGRRLRPSLSLALSSCLLTAGLPLATAWLAPAAALAATPAAARDLSADAKAAAAETVFNAAATLDAFKRVADDRLRGQRRQIEALQTRVKTAEAGRDAIVTTLRGELSRAQEGFVAELGARDRAYAREIAVFRGTVEDIAATPEGAEALRQFNAGEKVAAIRKLDQVVEAQEEALQVRVNVEKAAARRRPAMLALEAKGLAGNGTAGLIRRFEAITLLDPRLHWDWVVLTRLYTDAGQLDKAKVAAQRAVDTAENDRDRAVGLHELGDVLINQGDLLGATKRFREGMALFQRLAAANPSSAIAHIDVSVSLQRLGEAQFANGDLDGARESLLDGLDILQPLTVKTREVLWSLLEQGG